MRLILLAAPCAALCAALGAALPAAAETARHKQRPPPHADGGPKMLVTADDWIAATHQEGGQTVCYAFARAANSAPKLTGRGEVVLTVAQRPGSRDAVALSAGYAYPDRAEVMLQAETAGVPFYTAGRSAFARDGAAVVSAMSRAKSAAIRGTSPHGIVVDSFSLKGFSVAYAASVKACVSK